MSLIQMINRLSVQTAVYWGTPVNDGYGGYTFDDPVEILVRWEDKNVLFKDNTGRELISKAQVFIHSDYTVEEEGWLYLGDLDDSGLDSASTPDEVDGAFQIKRINKIPPIGKTENIISVYLLHLCFY